MAAEEIRYWGCNVAGVTFKNGQKSRQTILRQIKYLDPPFNNNRALIAVIPFLYNEQPAFEIRANNETVGFIPAEKVADLMRDYSLIENVFTFRVLGSGKDQPFGAEIIFQANLNRQRLNQPFAELNPIYTYCQLQSANINTLGAVGAQSVYFKLVKNKNEQFQEAITFAKKGDILHPVYDGGKDDYETDYGYLPKASEKYIDQKNSYIFVSDLIENERSTDVEVVIYYNVSPDLFPLDFSLVERKEQSPDAGMKQAKPTKSILEVEEKPMSRWLFILILLFCFPLLVSRIAFKEKKWYWIVLSVLSWIIYVAWIVSAIK